MASLSKMIKRKALKDCIHLIFLQSFAEQAMIAQRVEALMISCCALEPEIDHAPTHAAHLLQAVFKEAFAPAAAWALLFTLAPPPLAKSSAACSRRLVNAPAGGLTLNFER